jgi:hypothetical protein
VRTAHLLAVAVGILAVLALAPAVPVLSPVLCLAALLTIGELAVRSLVREPLTPAARLGLAVVAGLISLPLMALILNVLQVDIEGRWLAAALAVLTGALGACSWKRGPAGVATGPHPVHWVGGVEQPGTTTSTPPSTTRRGRTVLAVGVPAVLAILIGGAATVAYQRLPHPAEPGYTSLALAGWAAGIAAPVVIPAAGVQVPVQVSSAGEAPSVAQLLVRVGGRMAGPGTPVPIADGTRSVQVHVPAPPDGCLHAIRISLGPASTVFYGRGPGPARLPGRLVAPARPGRPAIRSGSIAC